MAWALTQTVVSDAPARHVLLCLANYAGEDGKGAFPSVKTLATQTGLAERTIQYKLGVLEHCGAIARGNQSLASAYIDRHDRLPVVYDLLLKANSRPANGVHLTTERGAPDAPRAPRGASHDTNGVHLTTERGAPRAPNTSFNRPLIRDSLTRARAPARDDAAGGAAIALRNAGVRVNSQNPNLILAIAEGVTGEDLVELAELHPGKPAGYLIAAARGIRAQAAAPVNAGEPRNENPRRLSSIERIEANVRRGQQRDGSGPDEAKAKRLAG